MECETHGHTSEVSLVKSQGDYQISTSMYGVRGHLHIGANTTL